MPTGLQKKYPITHDNMTLDASFHPPPVHHSLPISKSPYCQICSTGAPPSQVTLYHWKSLSRYYFFVVKVTNQVSLFSLKPIIFCILVSANCGRLNFPAKQKSWQQQFSFLQFNPSTELSGPLGIGKTKCETESF